MQKPFASRTNVYRSQREYPSFSRRVHTPAYSSLSDPHLEHYFRRKMEAERLALSSASTAGATRTFSPLRLQPRAFLSSSRGSSRASQLSSTKRRPLQKNNDSTYKVTVRTGNHVDAGTSAQVFVTIYGTKCKWSKKRLASKHGETFPLGSVRTFHLRGTDLGQVQKVCIEHNSVKKSDSWYLQHLVISNPETGQKWKCSCQKWLSLHHGDCQTSRTLSAKRVAPDDKTSGSSTATDKYNETITITVVTGDTRGAGTDANVFVSLHGTEGSTSPLHLKDSDGFDRGSTRVFTIDIPQWLGELSHLSVEHDNTGFSPAWFLEHVAVRLGQTTTFFPCGLWLAVDIGDKCLRRVLYPSLERPTSSQGLKYSIIVETGDVRGAGTDANVFVALSGSKGHTEKKKLESHPENFERGRKDEFTIKSESDLGMIETVHVSHDNTGPSPAWYIEKVTVIDSQHQNEYVFVCEQWLGRGFQNGCSITLQCASGGECANKPQITSLRSYMLELSTGAEPTSGTTADVYVILHGEKYSSEEQWLRECSDRSFSSSTSDTPTVSAPSFSPVTSNTPTVSVPSFSPVASDTLTVSAPSFSPDTTDTFTLSVPRKVHPVKKITVGHNCRGKSPAWFLKEVKVKCTQHGTVQLFPCQDWILSEQGERKAEKILYEQQSKKESNLMYSVSLKTGDDRDAGTNALIHAEVTGSERSTGRILLPDEEEFFERGLTDTFEYTWPQLGDIQEVVIGHDGTGEYPDWLLEEVCITCSSTGQTWTFTCTQWLQANKDITLLCTHSTPATRPLESIDEKQSLCSIDDDDESSDGSGGHLDGVGNEDQGDIYEADFSDNSLSAEESFSEEEEEEDVDTGSEDEEKVEQSIPYTIHMLLDANDSCKYSLEVRLVGSERHAPGLKLAFVNQAPSVGRRTETFSVDTVDVGTLQKVEIINRSSKRCHLIQMVVTSPTTQWSTTFLCSKPLEPKDTVSLSPTVDALNDSISSSSTAQMDQTLQAYELKIYTSDKKQASTANCLQVQLTGSQGSSKLFTIRNSSSKGLLQRGQIDSVQVASPALGSLTGMKITHAPAKKGSSTEAADARWHLYQIVVRDVLTKTSYSFPCKTWISAGVFVELSVSRVGEY